MVNKKTKDNDSDKSLSIPVTYYYIREYLPNILMEVVNRILFLSEKKADAAKLFYMDDIVMVPELEKTIKIDIVKRQVYYQKKQKPEKVKEDKKAKKE